MKIANKRLVFILGERKARELRLDIKRLVITSLQSLRQKQAEPDYGDVIRESRSERLIGRVA